MNLHSPVTDLKGIGEKTAVPFAKAGIHTVQDLIEYYPRAYELFEEPTEQEEMEDGKKFRKAGSIFSEELSRSETGNIEWNSRSITRWLIMRIFCI